ncbi:MAG: hypothetical protein ACLQRM_10380 [Acidimicrobiales bacterium]
MALWFFRGLARHVVTTRYPGVLDPWASGLPTPPSFIPSRLTFDLVQLLVESCPSGALWQEDRHLVVDIGACTTCGRCLRVAPDAVVASGAFELAATAPGHLVKRIPIRGSQQ